MRSKMFQAVASYGMKHTKIFFASDNFLRVATEKFWFFAPE